MDWLELARNLPMGQKVRADCPQCGEGTNTNAAVVNHDHKAYSLYCHACGYNPFESKGKLSLNELKHIQELNDEADKHARNGIQIELPDDVTPDIPLNGRLWLYKAGITEARWRSCGVCYSPSWERVIVPMFKQDGSLHWFQARAINEGQKPKYLQPTEQASNTVATVNPRVPSGSSSTGRTVVLVEDLLSAHVVGLHFECIALLGTKITSGKIKAIGDVTKVITWLDPDRAGRQGAYGIRKAYGLIAEVVNVVTDKDPKLHSQKEIRELLEPHWR